jgi:hypothetical protein
MSSLKYENTKQSGMVSRKKNYLLSRNPYKKKDISKVKNPSLKNDEESRYQEDLEQEITHMNVNNFLFYKHEEDEKINLKEILNNETISPSQNIKGFHSLLNSKIQDKNQNVNYKASNKNKFDQNEFLNNQMTAPIFLPSHSSNEVFKMKKIQNEFKQNYDKIKDMNRKSYKNEPKENSLFELNDSHDEDMGAIHQKLNLFQHRCKNYFKSVVSRKRIKKYKFKKIFDPKDIPLSMNSGEFHKKLSIFLYLPQLVLFNQFSKARSLFNSNKLDKFKLFSDSTTNISINLSQNNPSNSSRILKIDKYKKISKKIKRAWKLNQKIPVNIFKKQVRYLIKHKKSTSIRSESSLESSSNDDHQCLLMKNSGRISKERKSKLEAKNKIKNLMIRQRKQRSSPKTEKEYFGYKRLVGLKRNLQEFRDNEEFSFKKSKHQESDISFKNHLYPSLKKPNYKNLGKVFENQVDPPSFPNLKIFNSIQRSCRNKAEFEYVEFLDFSLKNINKPNFLFLNEKI